MILQTIYYILEGYVVFLAVVGAWRIAKSTPERGTYVNVMNNAKSENEYKPFNDLNPTRIFDIYRWFTSWKAEPKGVADLVILKKQFNWGLRFLMVSIVLQYILSLINV